MSGTSFISDGRMETYNKHTTPAGREVRVSLGRENSEDVVVLVDNLAVVAAFLRVPPVGVGITELALDGKGRGQVRVRVVAILFAISISTQLHRACRLQVLTESPNPSSPLLRVNTAYHVWVLRSASQVF